MNRRGDPLFEMLVWSGVLNEDLMSYLIEVRVLGDCNQEIIYSLDLAANIRFLLL